MVSRKLLSLGIALSLLVASGEISAKRDVVLAKKAAKLHALSQSLEKRDENHRRQARAWARNKGIPLRRVLPNGKVLELQRWVAGAGPTFYITNNIDAADTVSTDEVWPEGSAGLSLDGSGLTVGEWDGGAVLADHPDLYGRVTQVDGATEISNHATHVAGTLIGAGVALLPEARGMAYGANLDAWDWNSDTAEMAAAASSGLLMSNHSYGIAAGWIAVGGAPPDGWWWIGGSGDTEDRNFGYYDAETQLWDQIAFDAPYYLIVKAAGNDRWDTGPNPGEVYTIVDQNGSALSTSTTPRPPDCAPAGYDCLPTASVAKNILTVGAVNDVPGGYLPLSGPSQVQMTGFSGWGPTDDGRIKPDVVANGWLLMSTYGEDPYYAAALGTSMAAPNVTGSLLLLQEHYQDINGSGNFMRAATLKALAIHTADEAGAADGPDYEHGWGLLNTRAAAELITENGLGDHQIIEGSLGNGATETVQINVNQADAIVTATLVWTDPPGTPAPPVLDPTDSMLVNDLDLRITDGGSTYLPWVLNPASPSAAANTGDNVRDNVEQVVFTAAASGSYSVQVSHKNALLNGESQDYSLVISVGPPPPTSSGLLIDEDFSGGLPTGWSVDTISGVSWTINTPLPGGTRLDNLTGGSGKFAIVNNTSDQTITSLRTPVLDMSSTQAAILRFKSNFEFDFLETLNVDVSTDGGSNWTTAWQHQGFNPGPIQYTVDISAQTAGQADVMLRFRFDSGGYISVNYWQIDDVELEIFGGTLPPPPPPGGDLPGQAGNPQPTSSSSGLGLDTTLSWSAGQGATSHNVYFGTDSALSDPGHFAGNQTTTSFDPPPLDHATTYYWRIDEVNTDGTTQGITWNFTTAPQTVHVIEPGVTNSGQYGHGYGTNENRTELLVGFESTGTDLVLSVSGYDMDSADEVTVYLNGTPLGNLSEGPDEGLNAGDVFRIPAAEQLPGSNQIRFVVKTAGWVWGVTDLLLTESDIALTPGVLESGEYGNKWGTDENSKLLVATFESTGANLALSVTGYDMDSADEITVYLNGTPLGNLSPGADNGLNGADVFAIPAAEQLPGNNQLMFVVKHGGYKWGVTDLLLSESHIALIPDVLESGNYGNHWGTDENAKLLVASFESTGVDLALSVTGYDMDSADETTVYLNGAPLGYLSKGPNNGLNGADVFAIPASKQIPGNNQLMFVVQHQGWKWGVTDILLAQPDIVLTADVVESGKYGLRWGTNENAKFLVASFESTGANLALSVTGYDMDSADEATVYLNGIPLGNLSRGPNNGLNAADVFVIPASEQLPGSNQLLFVVEHRGWKWGVTDLLLAERDIALTPGVLETGEYGNRWGTDENAKLLVATFESTGTDLSLSVTGYDMDSSDEATVYINGVRLGNLRKGPDKGLNAGDVFSIPTSAQVPGNNQILFVVGHRGWLWGVTDLLLTVQNQ